LFDDTHITATSYLVILIAITLKESGFWTLSIIHSFLKNTAFRKLDLLLSSLVQSLSKEPNIVGTTFILPEDGNRSSFRNVVFLRKQWPVDEVQKPDSLKCNSPPPLSEPFRIDS
jgi:hypothetical protein